MPPRIAYWTTSFRSEIEAVAAEVALLRRRFPSSISWGVSRHHAALLSWRRGYCLHPCLHLAFRAATCVLEPLFQVNHLFGSLGDWFLLQGKRTRPTVLTAATSAEPVDRSLLDRVDRFVVEHPAGRDELQQLGIERDRVRLVLPPVDLGRFSPQEPPHGPFTVLFASSPDDASWLPARGVPQILEAAALRPDMQFRLLWRPWGDSLATVRRWIAERDLQNVDLAVGRVADMAEEYHGSHVTIVPFTQKDRCKPAPNSLVEGLACGRPTICTPTVGLANIVSDHQAGIVCQPTGASISESLQHIQRAWNQHSVNARRLAEGHFCETRFVTAYDSIYRELTRRRD